jgi:hypothetical protein
MANDLILVSTLPFTLSYLLLAVIPLYFELYCVGVRARPWITFVTTATTTVTFCVCPYVASTQCPPVDIILRLACSTAIMKSLDIYFRRNNPPVLKFPATPSMYAFYLLVELRYESFDITTARPRNSKLSTGFEYTIHLSIFVLLQMLPQTPIVKAFCVLFGTWLSWTFLNFFLKYPRSPSLFGPLYAAENLCSFWKETWHNVYTSPVRTLGYRPIRKLFGPVPGVLAGFGVMAIFHVWSLAPYVKPEGLLRVALFFMANGVGCVIDYAIWGERSTVLRTIVSWIYEIYWAQYTIAKCDLPGPWIEIDFEHMCRTRL